MVSPALRAAATLAFCRVALAGCSQYSNTSLASKYPGAATKSVDVVIVGGGSSGSNAAIHLLDAGLDVLVVEKNTQLGGMVNSYTDPNTGKNIDYGVAAYTNYTGTLEFFARLGIEATESVSVSDTTSYVDMTTGLTINYTDPSTDELVAALESFINVSSTYADLFLPSYANWPTAGNVPEELLMPFGELAQKHDLGGCLTLLWWTIVSGLADMLNTPSLYVFQTFGPTTAEAFLGEAPEYVPVSGRNQDIYDTIATILGSDSIFFNSLVVDSQRLANDGGVTLVVQDQSLGNYTIVSAKRLLMAIEPTADNVAPFLLDSTEQPIFSAGNWSAVNTGLVNHPSLPVGGMLTNLPADAANGNYYAYPEPPFVDYFQYLDNNTWAVIVTGWLGITAEEAQALAADAIDTMIAAGTLPASNGTMEVLAWSNHGAMDYRVSPELLQAGFVQEQYALQGYRSTFWTGAAFANQLSTFLWAYNAEYLVPLLLASL